MQEMDPSGTGRVSYDQFMDWYESARDAIEEGLQQAQAGGFMGGSPGAPHPGSPYPAAGSFGNFDGGGSIGGLYPGSLAGTINGGFQAGRGASIRDPTPRGFP